MALKQISFFIFFTVTSFLVCSSCSRKPTHDNLIKFIKAEKALRSRVGQAQGIEDSLKALREKHGIDTNISYADLIDEPDAWVDILNELKIGK